MHYFRLLFVLCIYLVPYTLLTTYLPKLDFGGPVLTLFGIEVPVIREVLILLLIFFEAPLLLASCEYMMALDAGAKPPILSMFRWFGEGERLYAAFRYGGFSFLLSLVLYPIQRLPRLWILSHAEEYSAAAAQVMKAAQSATVSEVDLSAVDQVMSIASGETVCLLLSLLSTLITLFFAAFRYVIAADSANERSFGADLSLAVRALSGHRFEYLILLLSFAGWYLLASLLGEFAMMLIYPYVFMAETSFLTRCIADVLHPAEPLQSEETEAPEESNE